MWSQPVGSALLVMFALLSIVNVPPYVGVLAEVVEVVVDVVNLGVVVIVEVVVFVVVWVCIVVDVVLVIAVELVLQEVSNTAASIKKLRDNQMILFFTFYLHFD
jgi:hypothetical protein